MLVITNIMKPRFTKRLPEAQRRRSILDAALIVLSREGYAGMTTARVARRVGVAEPILYRHFSSKRAILRALLEEVIARMMAAFREVVEQETDPVAALRRICRSYPDLARRYEREFRIINQSVIDARDPGTRLALERHYEAYHAFLRRLIEAGQQGGALRSDISADIGAWHMIHSALGFLMMQGVRKGAQSVKDLEGLAEATLAGLLKSS
jgi:AcrR family transcriptional regulator